METQQINSRNYSNLETYKSHPPPHYGKGINAPYFAGIPMRSAFNRGEIANNIVHKTYCCNDYSTSSGNNYVEAKMLRQKKQ